MTLTRFRGHLDSPSMLGQEVVYDEGEESWIEAESQDVQC
jgi:hypothetical protein